MIRNSAADLKRIVQETLEDNPGVRTKRWATGRCGTLSWDFAWRLHYARIPCRIIQLVGYRGPMYADRAKLWTGSGGEGWVHYVVRADRRYYDFTARQFHRGHDCPRIMTRSEVHEEWTHVNEVELQTGPEGTDMLIKICLGVSDLVVMKAG